MTLPVAYAAAYEGLLLVRGLAVQNQPGHSVSPNVPADDSHRSIAKFPRPTAQGPGQKTPAAKNPAVTSLMRHTLRPGHSHRSRDNQEATR